MVEEGSLLNFVECLGYRPLRLLQIMWAPKLIPAEQIYSKQFESTYHLEQ